MEFFRRPDFLAFEVPNNCPNFRRADVSSRRYAGFFFVRFAADAGDRGSASIRFTSASVAALTCTRVMLRDRDSLVLTMVQA